MYKRQQKRELEIIGEILAVSQDKFHDFIVSSLKFIDENELIIRHSSDTGEFTIAKLFRNMHTIKGNGRTYGLLHLADIVHEAEQHTKNCAIQPAVAPGIRLCC